jgi:hypothetical protein
MAAPHLLPARDPLFEARAVQYLRQHHSPETLAGVKHSRPPKGAVPVLVEHIYLLREKREDGKAAPCPICSPTAPKYLHGALAWFPDEGVYRCIGIECIARLCGADAAYKVRRDYDVAKARAADFEYAFEHIIKTPAMRAYFQALLPAAQHAEGLRQGLGRAEVRAPLWKAVKPTEGRLVGWEKKSVMRFNADTKEMDERTELVPVEFGLVAGLSALANDLPLSRDVRIQINNLNHFCFEDAEERVLDLHNDHQSLAAFRKAVSDASRTRKRVEERVRGVLAFFDPANFQRLNKFGMDPRTSLSLFASVKGHIYKIGPTMTDAVELRPDFAVLDALPAWPFPD